jgi:hypothetical protein
MKLILSHKEGPRTFPNYFHGQAVFQQLNTFTVAFNYVAAISILVLWHCPQSSPKRLAGATLNKHRRSVLLLNERPIFVATDNIAAVLTVDIH